MKKFLGMSIDSIKEFYWERYFLNQLSASILTDGMYIQASLRRRSVRPLVPSEYKEKEGFSDDKVA